MLHLIELNSFRHTQADIMALLVREWETIKCKKWGKNIFIYS